MRFGARARNAVASGHHSTRAVGVVQQEGEGEELFGRE